LRRKTNGSPEGKRKKGKRAAKGSVRRVWRRRERERRSAETGESLLGRGTNESSRSVNCDKKKGNEI
jgi:hypothetical protein